MDGGRKVAIYAEFLENDGDGARLDALKLFFVDCHSWERILHCRAIHCFVKDSDVGGTKSRGLQEYREFAGFVAKNFDLVGGVAGWSKVDAQNATGPGGGGAAYRMGVGLFCPVIEFQVGVVAFDGA